jgi:hypothetical protein
MEKVEWFDCPEISAERAQEIANQMHEFVRSLPENPDWTQVQAGDLRLEGGDSTGITGAELLALAGWVLRIPDLVEDAFKEGCWVADSMTGGIPLASIGKEDYRRDWEGSSARAKLKSLTGEG